MTWSEEVGEWQLKCVAYTGNNMRKRSPSGEDGVGGLERVHSLDGEEMGRVFLSYADELGRRGATSGGGRPRTARGKSARPKSSRPKSRR